jgi:2-dehydro-3-deoxyphosphooctonate aldolase (KDO 8-P synthase)
VLICVHLWFSFMQAFEVGEVSFGRGELAFLLGPCVVESVGHAMMMARSIKDICERVGVGFVYKSFCAK